MISYVKGIVLQKGPGYLIVENNGLGYKIFTIPELLDKKIGDTTSFFTYHKSGDDGQALFGLADFEALEFFELLITVSGIGPKLALSVLSSAKPATIRQAIASGDPDVFTRISGVGKKTAERIIVDLKAKVGELESSFAGSEIYDALIALGYSTKEVRGILQKIDTGAPSDVQLKEALRLLSK